MIKDESIMLTEYEKKIVLKRYFPTAKQSVSKNFKELFGPFFTRFALTGRLNGILAFNSMKRDDYEEFFLKVINTCSYANQVGIKKRRCLRVDALYAYIKYFIKSFDFAEVVRTETTDTNYNQSFINRILTISDMVSNYCMVKDLSNHDFKSVKGCLVFCDTLPSEAALVEACNKNNLISITCQHGIYIPSKKIENVHQLNYRYVPSMYALVWGVGTQKLIKKYNPNCKCVICGNPTIEPGSEEYRSDFIAVVGDIPAYKKYNQKMIATAEQYAKCNGLKVVIRLHPTDSPDDYKIDKTISSYGKNIDCAVFLLAHTSTMIFTYLSKGKRVFRLKSDIPYGLANTMISFTSLEELKYKLGCEIDFANIAKEQIEFCGSKSIERYTSFFETL